MKFAKSSLVKLFGASAIGLAVTGCASVPGTPATGCMEETKSNMLFLFSYSKRAFNKDCALKDVAEQYSQSADDGEKVLGQYLKEKLDPTVKAQADRVRDEATTKTAPYKVESFKQENGRKVYTLAPRPADVSASTPAAASAPAPSNP